MPPFFSGDKMKEKLGALLALSSATLFADCQAESCCTPCCIPQPRAPICCECYTPAFDDMQCDYDLFVDAEFLYWYSRENNLTYAVKGQVLQRTPAVGAASPQNALSPTEYKHLETNWEPGVRLGFGWKTCDGWDLSAYWTYYKNEKRNSVSTDSFTAGTAPPLGGFLLTNPWVDEAAFRIVPPSFDRISAKWNLRLNQIDLELGRKYFLSECFVMRPYMGLRGAFARTHFRTKSTFDTETFTISGGAVTTTPLRMPYSAIDSFVNKNWGVGLLGGLQPSWYFAQSFSIFGNIELALLWGEFKSRKKENYDSTAFTVAGGVVTQQADAHVLGESKDNFFGMQPILDLALGIRWERDWCENRYRFALDAGWEHHIWFDYNTRDKLFISSGTLASPGVVNGTLSNVLTSVDTKVVAETNNLMFGGFVLRARFDF